MNDTNKERKPETAPESKTEKTGKKPRRVLRRLLKGLVWSLFTLVVLAVVVFIGGVIYWNWYLPEYIETRLLPPCREQLGLDDMELKIRRIGLTGLDLETFVLTGEDGRRLSFDSIRADYTPHLPFRTPRALEITNLTLSGGDIRFAVKEGKFTISGFNLERVLARISELTAKSASSPESPEPPQTPETAAVVLEKITLRDLRLHVNYEGRTMVIPVEAVVTSENHEWKLIRAEVTLTPRGQKIHFNIACDTVATTAKINGDAEFRIEAFSDLTGGGIGGDAKADFNAAVSFAGGDVNALGALHVALGLGPKSGIPVDFSTPVQLHQNWSVRYRTAEQELVAILDGNMEPNAITFDSGAVQAKTTEPVRWNLTCTNTPDAGFRIAGANVTTGPVQFDAHGYTLQAPQLRLEEHDGHYLLSGSGMSVTNPTLKLNADAINLVIPLPATEKLPATLTADSIRLGDRELGVFRSTFYGRKRGIFLSGDFENKLIPGARIDFRGNVTPRPGEMPDMLFEVNVPPWSPKQPIALSKIRPEFGDATFTGVLSLGGAARFENGKLTTGVQIMLEDGLFDWPELPFKAEGIRLDLRFNDLLSFNTPAGQTLRVEKIRSGNLEFSDLLVLFDLTSQNQATIERVSVNWCGGTVMAHALRLNPSDFSNFALNTEIYCENLSLAELVTQLELSKASGDGVLFGKIPVRISSRRGVSIDTSYLYTRPGANNTIKLSDPEQIAGGMAGAALQQSQLDFALEALKDFTYSWAKLNFTTEKEYLVLSLQFDGKPNQALPFAYDEASGQLKRDPAGKALFEGIQLNINTRLPLNRLLRISEKFKQFNENNVQKKENAK